MFYLMGIAGTIGLIAFVAAGVFWSANIHKPFAEDQHPNI